MKKTKGFGTFILLLFPISLFASDPLFDSSVSYNVGGIAWSIFASDFNNDGNMDVAVANYNSMVQILENNGNGEFLSSTPYFAGNGLRSVFASDLDGDNDQDLTGAAFEGNTVDILKNNGSGVFAPNVDYATGNGPYSIFSADLDNDGDLDLAVANLHFLSNAVSVLKNNGDGTFSAKTDYAVGATPVSVFATDLDGDVDKDLMVLNEGSGTL